MEKRSFFDTMIQRRLYATGKAAYLTTGQAIVSTHRKQTIWRVETAGVTRQSDYLAAEEPLEIRLQAGGESRTLAITMRTPGHDYELAAGFLYSEGIITGRPALEHITYCVDEAEQEQQYNTLSVALRADRLPDLPHFERHFFTTSACGICGAALLDDLAARSLPPLAEGPVVPAALVRQLPQRLRQAQHLFERTGGLHAAALFDASGRLLAAREDVGRHNALDKLVGWGVLNDQLPFHDGIILVSGRASYELLQKCRTAGASILCAVSAPSTLAVSVALRFGVTLVGFLRPDHFNIYAGPERIQTP